MADPVVYAMLDADPDVVAVTEFRGVCWPAYSLARARRVARQIGAGGIWKLKPRPLV